MPHADWSSFSFDGIGTHWEISTPDALGPAVRHQLLETVSDYDTTYSRFRPDSLVSALSREPGRITLPGHAAALHDVYAALYRLSGGAMTPLIGSSLERLGYDPGYTLAPSGNPQAPPRWEDVLEWTGTALTATEPVVLDVGAAGKGQLVDLLGGVLQSTGHSEFLIDGSGDMLHAGTHPVMVALEHPYNPRPGHRHGGTEQFSPLCLGVQPAGLGRWPAPRPGWDHRQAHPHHGGYLDHGCERIGGGCAGHCPVHA